MGVKVCSADLGGYRPRRGTSATTHLDRRHRLGARARDARRQPAQLAGRRRDPDAQRHRRRRGDGGSSWDPIAGTACSATTTLLVEQLVAHHDGQVVKFERDGFLASFNSAHGGLHAAVELQRTFAERPGAPEATISRCGSALHSGFLIGSSDQLLGPQRRARRENRRDRRARRDPGLLHAEGVHGDRSELRVRAPRRVSALRDYSASTPSIRSPGGLTPTPAPLSSAAVRETACWPAQRLSRPKPTRS